ncbi:MAG TPA: energy transducer TonB [Steroidobacteraceae bacterium]|nr:energy transducer TonB [Steroidobacteraceae bacterium]
MSSTARAVVLGTLLVPAAFAQVGPSDPQVIASASTAKVNVGNRKLAGQLIGTVRVGTDGKVRDVLVTEKTTEPSFEAPIVKVLESAKFRPALDDSGKPVEASIEMKVELRASTGAEPKPVAAKPDPQLTEKEKARILKMACRDFIWEWDFIRDEAKDGVYTEFMPRIAVSMYAAARSQAGDVVDAKVWPASKKGLKEAVDRCRDNPAQLFWQDTFKPVMDEAVPK